MKILIGIDESEFSKEALRLVKAVRWPADARIIVLSAVQSAIAAYAVPGEGSGMGLYAGPIEDLTKYHQELTARAEADLRTAGFQTEARVVLGDPGEVIVRVARDENVDLIVVGSHGRTGLAKLVLGSVANHVMTHAPCSVLVAKLPSPRIRAASEHR